LHTKLHNRLDVECAAKLVFYYRMRLSTLGVFHVMRSVNVRYLLTYLCFMETLLLMNIKPE